MTPMEKPWDDVYIQNADLDLMVVFSRVVSLSLHAYIKQNQCPQTSIKFVFVLENTALMSPIDRLESGELNKWISEIPVSKYFSVKETCLA